MTQELLQYLFSGLTAGAIYAIIAIGFSMLYSATDLINFAHGELVMMGGMTLTTFWVSWQMPLLAAIALTIPVMAFVGFLFERLAIRTVKKPDPIVLVIITVGASIFLRGIGMIIWGKDPVSVPAFIDNEPISIAGATLMPQSLLIMVGVAVLAGALFLFYRKTLTGMAMTACAINRRAAWMAGIPAEKMVMLAFALSASVGAVAGVSIAPVTMCSYDMGTMLGIKGFCAAMLGGLGSLWGALIGGILLGVLESLGVGLVSSGLKDATAFLLLLMILYIRPSGLFGRSDTSRF